MKIALIGMPTSGKSTISNILVQDTGYSLIDLDSLLEKRFRMSLQQFINTEGEHQFLKQENALMLSIKYPKNCIISTGGSVVYASEAMEKLKSDDVRFIYLKVPIEVLLTRLSGQRDMRGVIMNGSNSWEELLDDRDHFYHKYADLVIDTSDKSAHEISQEIMNYIFHKGTR